MTNNKSHKICFRFQNRTYLHTPLGAFAYTEVMYRGVPTDTSNQEIISDNFFLFCFVFVFEKKGGHWVIHQKKKKKKKKKRLNGYDFFSFFLWQGGVP